MEKEIIEKSSCVEDPMERKLLYEDAYRRLNIITPLKTNCGQLCGNACCQEGDEITGMHLFPGEEELLIDADFLSLISTSISLSSGKKILLAVCCSRCNRVLRPLACRIFPLTFYLDSKGTLETIVDPRAVQLCPLAQGSGVKRLNPAFIRAVRNVGLVLADNPEIREFIDIISRSIDEMIRL